MRIQTDNPAGMFKALGDDTRLRIVRLLAGRPLCVCQIVDALAEPQYKISRHLAILKHAGLVVDRRIGTWMHYSLAPDLDPLAREAIRAIAARCCDGVYVEDERRLAESRPRIPASCEVAADVTEPEPSAAKANLRPRVTTT